MPCFISFSLLFFYTYGILRSLQAVLTSFQCKSVIVILNSLDGYAGVNIRFPDDNLKLLWPIDNKLGVWVTDVKSQLGISTQMSVIKVKVTVAKNRKSLSAQ